MEFKKIILAVVALGLLITPAAFAGEGPEFDVVGCDSKNYFNDKVRDFVVYKNYSLFDKKVNHYSDFTDVYVPGCEGEDCIYAEYFISSVLSKVPDPCFKDYYSHMVPANFNGWYEWQIVLQETPESDLNINIRDCVEKYNSYKVFGDEAYAGLTQTGRYVMPWGEIFFVNDANPRITVTAVPGPQAQDGFEECFIMDGRKMPGLFSIPLNGVLYTSKGLWTETIVVERPGDSTPSLSGAAQAQLYAGDMIRVRVTVPRANTADIFYGEDNVAIEYVGIYGTEWTTYEKCDWDWGWGY